MLVSPGSGERSVGELVAAHRSLGHEVSVVDAADLAVEASGGAVRCGVAADVVHSRVSVPWAWGVQAALEASGVRCVNDLPAVVVGRDKWACHLALAAAGVAAPDSTLLLPTGDPVRAVAAVGGYPVVVKELLGHGGDGVRLVEGGLVAAADRPLLVQHFYREAAGEDLRIDVVAGRVAARWRRRASAEGEFRANVALGGTCTVAACDPEIDALAVAAAEACGLTLAGVDVLVTDAGPVVVEVNTNAGVADAVALDGDPVAVWHARAVAAAVG
jgi:ribosomal protein S6--L-glutamate ligase